MTTRKIRSIVFAAGLALMLVGCSSGDNTRRLPGYYNAMGGFGVIASSPAVMDVHVPRTTDLRIKFNEGIDPATVTGNFTLTEYIGNTSNDVTSILASPQLSDSNSLLIFQTTEPFSLNANYRLTLTSGIKSVSGRDMVQMFDLLFSTGAGTGVGFGMYNDPNNPPSVVRFTRDIWYSNLGPCVGLTVEFSEDLIDFPKGRVKSSVFNINWLQGFEQPLVFWKTYSNRNNYWSADIGCGCQYFNMSDHYNIEIFEAIDMTEDAMTPAYTNDFGIPFLESCGGLL